MNIGSITAFVKSYSNTPTLNVDFVECNGQTLNDPASPYHNQVIPNLNGSGGGTQRFLRGSTTSGTTGGADTNTHNHTFQTSNAASGVFDKTYGLSSQNQTISILPPFYQIVWVIKIK